jgi:hypothetical protein
MTRTEQIWAPRSARASGALGLPRLSRAATKRSTAQDVPEQQSDDASEYDAFEGLTEKLLRVGKKELDDAVAKKRARQRAGSDDEQTLA